MKRKQTPLALAILAAFATHALAQDSLDAAPLKQMGTVVVTGNRPTSLPTQIPTTIEGITAAEIARTINALDAEDALKYLPSLLVRKRYIGDYNHAVLSTRASGTGNSARSAVYADGILLSNYLGNGATSRRAGAWSRRRKSSASTCSTGRSRRLTAVIPSARWSTT